MVSRTSKLLLLDVPVTATEQVRTCGFQKKFIKLRQAPKMRDSVQKISSESFLVTLPSISSETWEMFSWANSGSSVFCDWLFLVFSGVSPETAADFSYSPRLPWYWGKCSVSCEDWIEIFLRRMSTLVMREKIQWKQAVKRLQKWV